MANYRQQPGLNDYDGVNVYGDSDIGLNVGQLAAGVPALQPVLSLLPTNQSGDFTPTGFTESEFIDNTTESIKLGTALHYRINDNLELIGQFNWGQGSTVYTANDRFVLDNFNIWTGKVELKSDNFFGRVYTTQENSGDTYAANVLASLINGEYVQNGGAEAYLGAFATERTRGGSVDEAHIAGRVAYDAGRPTVGSAAYNEAFDRIRQVPISQGGAKFLDNTSLWHAEGMYNFSEKISFAEVIVGGNVRQYRLNSEGTLFALENIDAGDEFNINEFGAYAQIAKKLIDDRLAINGSVRYDKNENFAGQFSPRISGVYSLGENKSNNFRASFQRGFRIPTTQDQFINLDVRTRRLVGSNSALVDQFNFRSNPVYNLSDIQAVRRGELNQDQLQAWTDFDFETEKVSTFEFGYKSVINNKLLIDAYYYVSNYTDFITEVNLVQDASNPDPAVNGATPRFIAPGGGTNLTNIVNESNTRRYGFDVNSDETIRVQGAAVSLEYLLGKGYTIGGNTSWNKLNNQEDLDANGLQASFNTPEWRFNFKVSNSKLTDNLGFNIQYKWQDAFLWESSFGEGIVPSFGSLDAQVSYKIEDLKSILKIGGSNILNERYTTSFGNPRVGSLYYIAISFDEFLN